MQHADVIVVGLGAIGSATSYQLAKRRAKVIGIDRFSPPHIFGSTHGDTRITRQAIGEGKCYVPLVLRSHELWREIEVETGASLFTACGGLILVNKSVRAGLHGVQDFFAATVSAAEEYCIEHELMSTDEARNRFPQFRMNDEYRCYYEPGAGFVRPEAAVATQLQLARRHGARIQTEERVNRVESTSYGVMVHTDKAVYGAEQMIIAAGPWIGQLIESKNVEQLCSVYRQGLHWFPVAGSISLFTPDRMPVFVWKFGSGDDDMFYGFPAIDGPNGGLKVATEQHHTIADPDDLGQNGPSVESEEMYARCVDGRLPLFPSVIRSATCLYTVTPDQRFIIDRHPECSNVLLASSCSGHGFKYSPAIGESLAQWALQGKPAIDLSAFTLNRFAF